MRKRAKEITKKPTKTSAPLCIFICRLPPGLESNSIGKSPEGIALNRNHSFTFTWKFVWGRLEYTCKDHPVSPRRLAGGGGIKHPSRECFWFDNYDLRYDESRGRVITNLILNTSETPLQRQKLCFVKLWTFILRKYIYISNVCRYLVIKCANRTNSRIISDSIRRTKRADKRVWYVRFKAYECHVGWFL